MDDSSNPASVQRINLTRETDVAYWCRIFDVSIDQLRHAVQHAGHEVPAIRRYLSQQLPPTTANGSA
jgi:hypothetical protein